ncbi:MFS transporter [Chitinasiproducens palmae]|uniref:MFS transporter, ACS family, D-galactonate transporter n=1 Tax=Chitinasiproducens palmae TaxID=1770053 RepID=A0A1H2PMF2_9BURK|nr:MFS transporter [Chitinasiproducens palmae]SDV47770.1 MFS transporter, ACS family, D-galactonate transporter [Chitinasiproducens palmae]
MLQQPATRHRYVMLLLVFGATALNFVDRANLAVVAPALKEAFGLDPVALGFAFSAYAWTYALCNLPGGYLVDRFGSRTMYAVAIAIWSVLTFSQGLVTRFGTLFGLRMGVGIAEAPTFPVNNRVVSIWFPRDERGLATSVYIVGQYVGMAFLTPLMFWVFHHFGWRAVFYATGAVGLLWSLVWYGFYRDPAASRANAAERALLRAGGALDDTQGAKPAFSWRALRRLLSDRQIIAVCIGKFAVLSTLYFFLTWFPTYLITERHMTVLKTGTFAALPFIAASIGVLFGGMLSDRLLRAGMSVSAARKTPIVGGLLLVPSMTLAIFAHSDAAVIAIMSFAFFAQGVSSCSWSLMADIAPKGLIGLAGGAVNFAGNLSGIVTPIAIGYIVRGTGSFALALVLVSVFALIGAACYTFLLGEVKRIELVD